MEKTSELKKLIHEQIEMLAHANGIYESDEIKEIAKKLFFILSRSDFSNGVQASGMDEGEIKANHILDNIQQRYEEITGEKV